MINRIFKTILVLSICIGISLPTNAAVSVSDGSAFVTKAEFAADLNNLSNRMAQLENSLDAKIDSLVSSYLTRNGIWNGAKQDIADDLHSYYVGIGANYQTDYSPYSWRIYNYSDSSQTLHYSVYNTSDVRCPIKLINSNKLNGTVVTQFNKSGLVDLVYDFKFCSLQDSSLWDVSVRNKLIRCGPTTNATGLIYGDTVALVLAASITFSNQNGVAYSCDHRSVPAQVPGSVYGYYVPNVSLYFFANKGESLNFSILNYCRFFNVGVQTSNNIVPDWGFYWKVKDIYVY